MTPDARNRLVNLIFQVSRAHAAQGGCAGKKLFKVLYVLDVLHFQRTGRTMTDLEYAAGDFGPYPWRLCQELSDFVRADLDTLVTTRLVDRTGHQQIIASRDGAEFDPSNFSPRQVRLIGEVLPMLVPLPQEALEVSQYDRGAFRNARASAKHTTIDFLQAVDVGTDQGREAAAQARRYSMRNLALARTLGI